MTIIFDFNRTIFNPETGSLLSNALEVLKTLRGRGHTLYLVSRLEPGREAALSDLGIDGYFKEAKFVNDKREALKEIISASPSPTYVIGDYLHDEIRAGNELGAKTIWLKRGRFADLIPKNKDEEPWHTIDDLMEVLELIA